MNSRQKLIYNMGYGFYEDLTLRSRILKRLGLALGGGGAKGIAHIAFLEKLDEMGITPSVIAGTSMGAIVGAVYCSGMKAGDMMAVLERMDEKASRRKKGGLLLRLTTGTPAYRGEFMKRFIDSLLPVKTFEELKIPFKVSAVDFYTLEEKVFTSGSLLDAVMASAALPPGVYPYQIGDRFYIDGGAVNSVPATLIRDECDVLAAIDVSKVRPTAPGTKPTLKNARSAMMMAGARALMAYKMEEAQTDLFYKVLFDNIGTLDFFKFREAYATGQRYAERFAEDIHHILK